jgi:hypothetical protein
LGRTQYLRKNPTTGEEPYTVPWEEPYNWGRTPYLGKNGDTLQIDGEGPEDLHGGELVVEHQGKQGARTQQEFDPECTMKFTVKVYTYDLLAQCFGSVFI